MTIEEVNQHHINQHNALEAQFFRLVNKGKPNQHRLLKAQKSLDEFDQKHAEIWKAHEAELIAQGFMEAPTPPEPIRNPLLELDVLKERLKEQGIRV